MMPPKARSLNSMNRSDRLRDALDGLSQLIDEHRDALWASIDHRDPEAVEAGTARYRTFHERADELRAAADRLAEVLGEPAAPIDSAPRDIPRRESSAPENIEQPPRDVDPGPERGLDEEVTHTKPVAVRIQETHYDELNSWRGLYEEVCRHLSERDPERFARLPSDPRFISRRDRHDFSRRPQDLRVASPITDGIFAEVHFSAKDLRKRIVKLLDAFGLPTSSVGIYLRSDRPA